MRVLGRDFEFAPDSQFLFYSLSKFGLGTYHFSIDNDAGTVDSKRHITDAYSKRDRLECARSAINVIGWCFRDA